jgi:hypothetical protein
MDAVADTLAHAVLLSKCMRRVVVFALPVIAADAAAARQSLSSVVDALHRTVPARSLGGACSRAHCAQIVLRTVILRRGGAPERVVHNVSKMALVWASSPRTATLAERAGSRRFLLSASWSVCCRTQSFCRWVPAMAPALSALHRRHRLRSHSSPR